MTLTDSSPLICDVCIIGGNIAGSFLASLLSRKEITIIVVEEHKSTGVPLQCAGIVSQKIAEIINLDENFVLNRIRTAQLMDPTGIKFSVTTSETPYVIDRIKLDKKFSGIAKDNGVRFLFSEKFQTYSIIEPRQPQDQNILMIRTNKRVIFSKLIVGCDGPNSKVAALNGMYNNLLYGMQIRARYEFPSDTVQMMFDQKWNDLFGWIIPEGNGICRIGIGACSNPKSIFHSFINKLRVNKSQIINRQGGYIPYGYCRKIAFERCILLGDAACMVKATTGGGIIMLLSAAKIAQKAIISAIQNNNFSRKFLKKEYSNDSTLKSIKKELRIHYIARLFLKKIDNHDFKRIFEILKDPKVKNIIDAYGDMDFPKKFLFRLLLNPKIFRIFALNLLKNLFLSFQILHVILFL